MLKRSPKRARAKWFLKLSGYLRKWCPRAIILRFAGIYGSAGCCENRPYEKEKQSGGGGIVGSI